MKRRRKRCTRWWTIRSRQAGLTADNESELTYLSFGALRQGDQFLVDVDMASFNAVNDVYNLVFIPLDEYNRSTGESRTLGEGEALLYANRKPYEPDTLSVLGETFVIREKLSSFSGINEVSANIASTHYLIVKDMQTVERLEALQKEAYAEHASFIERVYGFDLPGDDEQDTLLIYGNLLERRGISGLTAASNAVRRKGRISSAPSAGCFLSASCWASCS